MTAKPIIQLGDPILRRRAGPVPPSEIRPMQKLIATMIHAMRRAKGVGIAAPQIGVSRRLFIVASQPNKRYPHAPKMKPLAMINPRLTMHSKTMRTGWEGCLSIPGIRGQVPRYDRVQIQYTAPDGTLKRSQLAGFVARLFQHELDHLNGKVFLDRVADTRTLVTEKEYLRSIHGR